MNPSGRLKTYKKNINRNLDCGLSKKLIFEWLNYIWWLRLSEIDKEIEDIKLMLEKIEGIIDSRLIGVDEPDEDEILEVESYIKKKKSGELVLHEI